MRRRTLMSKIPILVVCFAFSASSMAGESTNIGADDALSRLLSENRRFVAGKSNEPTGPALIERRHALAKEQKPFAVVVSCSDSRVPPELVFDVGLGDIFVVRTAGEVVDEVGLGSIEYAVEHLGTHLILVLGHQHCGAVSAAVAGATETGDIPNVLRAISPAIEETKGQAGDPIENAVRANARDIAKHLQSAGPIIAPRVQSGEVKIVAAYYSLDTGQVELLKWSGEKKSGPTAQRSYGVDVVSDVLPFGRLCYGGENVVSNAIGYAQHFSRSHDAVIRVYNEADGNVIKTHEHAGEFKEWWSAPVAVPVDSAS